MREAQIRCSSCGSTHRVCAELHPRAFSFDCPKTGAREDIPFHDPSRTVKDWEEVERRSADAVDALNPEAQGRFDL